MVFWTLTIFDRAEGWLTTRFTSGSSELMLHAAAREGLVCPIYCLMPDHLHLVWMGLHWIPTRFNGMTFLRTYLEPELCRRSFNHRPHDEVCGKNKESVNAFAKICFYIAGESCAGRIIGEKTFGHSPAAFSGYPRLNPADEDFWRNFGGFTVN